MLGDGPLYGAKVKALFFRLFYKSQFATALTRFEFASGDGAGGTG